MKTLLKKSKEDKDYKFYELILPNRWDLIIPFIKKNPVIWVALTVLMIFYSVWAGNLTFFGFVIHLRYLFAAYLGLQILYKIDSRVSIGLGLFSLLWSANFLVNNEVKKAESLAIFAYVFLSIGVLWQFYELYKGRKDSEAKIK